MRAFGLSPLRKLSKRKRFTTARGDSAFILMSSSMNLPAPSSRLSTSLQGSGTLCL